MKKIIFMIICVMISASVFAGNKKVANRASQPKTYVDKNFSAVAPENNVSYEYSFVRDHYHFLTHKPICMDTVRVFSCNGIKFRISGNFSDSQTSTFNFKTDIDLLKGRNLNIVKVQLPKANKEGKSWKVTYYLHDIAVVDDNTVIVRFNTYSDGKEELRAVKVNRSTGESIEVATNIDGLRRYHGGRSYDANYSFAELHTTPDNQTVVIWR